MRRVRRGPKPPPASLSRRNRDGKTELQRVREHFAAVLPPGTTREAFTFTAYKSDDVKQRLEELFHGKCAYCESFYASQAPVDVEHYRPKGAVEGDPGHPGYWWIAMDWENLLPSCLDCNRRRRQQTPAAVSDLRVLFQTMSTGKKDAFPIAGTRAVAEASDFSGEQALLLDPTRDEPDEHIQFYLGADRGSGLAYPRATGPAHPDHLPALSDDHAAIAATAAAAGLSARGAVSIQVYGLNRMKLVQERAAVVRRLRFLESLLVDLGKIATGLDQPHLVGVHPEVEDAIRNLRLLQGRILSEMTAMAAPEAPFSTMAAAYLADFKRRLG